MTFAPASLTTLARYWTANGGTNLGVVGDTRHKARGVSYHLGVSALTPDAYSRKTTRDRTGLSEAASALDLGRLNGSLPELREFSVWLVARCRANAPGTQDIREVIYSPDGKTVLRWDRERGIPSEPKAGEADTSHLTHTHLSFYRDSEKRPKTAAFAPYFATPKEAPVSEQDRLGAAIMSISTKYLINVLRAKDQPGILKWSTRLADYATRLAALVSPALTKVEAADIHGLAEVPAAYFDTFEDGSFVYLTGGSPNNPAGVSFSYADARKWWEAVFAAGLNIGRVRSTLTPGSEVLSAEGAAAARVLGAVSTAFAPEDYNPLNLSIIP